MADQASALKSFCRDAGCRERTWFFQGMGLGALMLVGVYSLGGLRFQHEWPSGSGDLLGHDAAVAFIPAVPVRMNGGQRFSGQRFSGIEWNPEPTAYSPSAPQVKQRATSTAMSLASEQQQQQQQQQYLANLSAGDSMALLATTAIYSAGDPSKLASVFQIMPDEDLGLVERWRDDVWAYAEDMPPGVSEPLGFWDPLGFCADCSEGRLCFYREVEVKHGRIAMLATLGFLVAERFHPFFPKNSLPSYISWDQVALKDFWKILVVSIAIPEMLSVFTFNEPWKTVNTPYGPMAEGLWSVKRDRGFDTFGPDRGPDLLAYGGDLGFDPMGLKPTDPREYKRMQTVELNHGRLAMIAAAGMLAQEMATGRKLFR